MLVTLASVQKYHNEKCILHHVSFTLEEREKVALIGVNGTGKSTLLAILAGMEHYDSGQIMRKKGLRTAYLAQTPILNDQNNVLQEVMADAAKDTQEYEAKAMLGKLGIYDYEQSIAVLSGGVRKRVALAKVLLQESDLLLLDEPTNHLDVAMIEWLEGYLIKCRQAVCMVSHDRYFMERITQTIIELDHGALYRYQGNYETYVAQKQERMALEQAHESKRQALLRKELAWVRAGVQARGTKDKGRLERFRQLSEEAGIERQGELRFTALAERLGKKVIELDGITKAYGTQVLFQPFAYPIQRMERIGIIGGNGCGKSTLLKILAGEIQADAGTITYGETVKIGYFAQGNEMLDETMRIIDVIQEVGAQIQTSAGSVSAAQLLEQFLFERTTHYQSVSTLSGGEKRRLYLLKVLVEAPNVLLLDEPTNDLDLTTLQLLEDYLDTYPGVVIVVSHDRYFLDRICDTLWYFEDSTIQTSIGGYAQYRDAKTKPSHAPQTSKQNADSTSLYRPKVIISSKEKREYAQLEHLINELEQRIMQCDEAMGSCGEDYRKIQEYSDQRQQLEQELETSMERWMELEEKYAAWSALQRKN